MRFAAPADTSAISLACGEFAVENGHIEVPDEIGPGDLAGLAVHGFTPAIEEAAPADTSAKPAKVKG